MNTTTSTDNVPWFRYRIVWLVIAIPALTVAGCLLTIYLAITSPHQIVGDPELESDAPAAADR